MTTKTTTLIEYPESLERFPDYPPRDDMQNWLHLYETTIAASLAIHFSDRPDVIVACEVPIAMSLPRRLDVRIPDLSVMIGGDRDLMIRQKGYAIDRQGKAPDFALEVASESTGVKDYTFKRVDYERFGIREYWRYDPSGGKYHDAPLAGDRLVDGRYEPIPIETLSQGILRGYSETLGLWLYWEFGELRFFDPQTDDYIRTHFDDRAWADEAMRLVADEARAAEEATLRADAEARRAEEATRLAAEEARRADSLEAELRRLRGE